MIIDHEKEFAFFRIPKTGSTTAECVLRLTEGFGPGAIMSSTKVLQYPEQNLDIDHPMPQHLTPTEAIDFGLITLDQLRRYKAFAFVRDPLDRAVSSYCHKNGRFAFPDAFHTQISADSFTFWDILGVKQSDYFEVAGEVVLIPLLFDRFDAKMHQLIALAGGHQFKQIPRLNVSSSRRDFGETMDFIDPESERILQEHYARDFQLYKGTETDEKHHTDTAGDPRRRLQRNDRPDAGQQLFTEVIECLP